MSSWLAGRLPARCGVVLDSLDDLQGYLFPEEDALLGNAISKRSREFRAGRTAARKAMLKLGMPTGPVLKGSKNEPLWPQGCVGTISHSGEYSLAIVSPSSQIRSLGADLEQMGRVKAHLWPRIFSAGEKEYLLALPGGEVDRAATAMFSAKEAFFKLQYPLTGEWLEFLDAEVRIEAENRFSISSGSKLKEPMPGQTCTGTWVEWQDCCVAVMGIHFPTSPQMHPCGSLSISSTISSSIRLTGKGS